MEMTGLDEKVNVIIEIAVVITDLDFNVLEEYETAVFQPQSAMDLMDSWCQATHTKSGLVERVKTGAKLEDAEKAIVELISRHFKADERIVLAGNSVGNDRRFIDKYMPNFAKRLHYRLIDVSSYKEVFRNKYGIQFKKSENHMAKEDIMESIKELQTYLSYVQIPSKTE